MLKKLVTDLKSPDYRVRRKAVADLRKYGKQGIELFMTASRDGTQAIDLLITALQDENKKVAYVAAEVLGDIGDARVVEPLIAALGDWDGDLVKRAADALAKIGDKRAVVPLIQALNENRRRGVRRQAAKALGLLGDGRAGDALMAHLIDDEDDVNEAAGEALRRLGDRRAADYLLDLITGEDKALAEKAAMGLRWLGDKRAVQPVINHLIRCKYSYAAFNALIELDVSQTSPELVPAVISALLDCYKIDDRDLHYGVTLTLESLGDAAILTLIKALTDEYEQLHWRAAFALGMIGDTRAIPTLQWVAQHDTSKAWYGKTTEEIAIDAIRSIEYRTQPQSIRNKKAISNLSSRPSPLNNYKILECAFPNGIEPADYFPLLAAFHDIIPDLDLAHSISSFTGKDWVVVLRDVHRVVPTHMPQPELVAAMKQRLIACGADFLA